MGRYVGISGRSEERTKALCAALMPQTPKTVTVVMGAGRQSPAENRRENVSAMRVIEYAEPSDMVPYGPVPLAYRRNFECICTRLAQELS